MVASKLCEIIVVIIIFFFYHFVFLQIDKENPKNKLAHKHEDELLLKNVFVPWWLQTNSSNEVTQVPN